MPKRDITGAEGTGAGRAVSRRAVLAGVGVALCFPPAAGAALAPIRVGVPAMLPINPECLSAATLRLCGRAALVVPFDSWSVLADHAEAGGCGRIDAAMLPTTSSGSAAVQPERPPAIWFRPGGATPGRVGVAIGHPASDAALRRLLGGDLHIMPLPPGALAANLAAGLIHAAVVPDEAAELPSGAGLARVRLHPEQARALLPPLALLLVGAGA